MSNILHYAHLTDEQFHQLNKKQTIALLPISLLEAHGPHLPLGTDFLIAEKFSQLLAERLQQKFKELTLLLLPIVPIGAGGIQRSGTLSHEPSLIKNVLVQFGQQLAAYGLQKGIIVSGHAGKDHLKAMSSAARKLKKQSNFEFLPLTSYMFMDAGLNKMGAMLQQKGNPLPPYDGHAGLWETSVMLYLHAHLVKNTHKKLSSSDDAEKFGYRGNPAGAQAQIGQKLIAFLLEFSLVIIEKHFFTENP